MLICEDCGKIFDEADASSKSVCWEDYYGVGGMFHDHHWGTIATCPECGSEELDDYYEDEEEEETE